MPYYTNPRSPEPFTGYHEECFPVTLPAWFEICGAATPFDHVAMTFGGESHLIKVAAFGDYHERDSIVRCHENAEHRCTPDGWNWAPWKAGVPCASCGVDC